MPICSDRMSNRQVELTLSTIEDAAYLSRRDGCLVMLVECQECSRMFEDEVDAFRETILARKAVLCLACDDDAVVPSFSGITIQIGWHS